MLAGTSIYVLKGRVQVLKQRTFKCILEGFLFTLFLLKILLILKFTFQSALKYLQQDN